MGKVLGDEIMCNYHGWVMDADGRCVHVPHQDSVAKSICITSYTAIERWGLIWIWIGDPDKVDDSLIPAMPWAEDANQSAVHIRFYVEANYQLMADNLLDVSHSDFLHTSSFGSRAGQKGETDEVKAEIETWTENGTVYGVRTLPDVMLAPMAMAWGGFTKRATRIHRHTWTPPNNINIELIMENEENKVTIHHDHIMTPETENSCHYFMIWTRDFSVDGGYPSDADVRREQTSVIEAEDIPMVEAQQRNRIRFGDPADVIGAADKYLTAVHKRIGALQLEQRR
jgi:vanillate O-demethylase monooxygenase subunit